MFYSIFLLVTVAIFNQNVWSQKVVSSVNVNCTINHDGHLLKEGESIEIRGKLYKMEGCGLHRAYHACGSYLLQMVSIACEVVQQNKQCQEKNVSGDSYDGNCLLKPVVKLYVLFLK